MKTQILTSIILLVFAFGLNNNNPSNNQDELEAAPEGYAWQSLDNVKAFVLVPDDWFFHAEQKGNTYAYFITKEDYTKDPNGMFVTGFSINVFTNMGNNNALEYANKFAEQMQKDNEVIFIKDHEFSNFKGKILRIKNKEQYIQYMIVANTKTNKLYLTYFESSITRWEKNEEFGKTIMDKLALDPEY